MLVPTEMLTHALHIKAQIKANNEKNKNRDGQNNNNYNFFWI